MGMMQYIHVSHCADEWLHEMVPMFGMGDHDIFGEHSTNMGMMQYVHVSHCADEWLHEMVPIFGMGDHDIIGEHSTNSLRQALHASMHTVCHSV